MRRRSGIDKTLSAANPAIPPVLPIPANPTNPTMLGVAFQNAVSARPLERAIKIVGKVSLARKLGVAYQSVDKWIVRGMPKSEWDGRTTYCKIIEEATDGEITRDMLMDLHK
jgi:hypothetical protein